MPKSHKHQEAPQPRNRLAAAANTARDSVDDVATRTVEIIEENPLAVLAGGLAIGAVIAALIPKSRREVRLLAPVGRQITDRARGAVDHAKESAKEQLGLSSGGDGQDGSPLVQGVLKAVATAGLAALQQQQGSRPQSHSAND